MLKGAYSEKFKSIQRERLEHVKEERKQGTKLKTDRAKELSKETNRRRRALEERKKEQQQIEEKIREEALAKRRQEQQEATKKFQKDTVHKTKPVQDQNGGVGVTQHDQDPNPVVQDGRYVVRGHVVEVKDGKQLPYNTERDIKGLAGQTHESDVWRLERQAYTGADTRSGILYAINNVRNEVTLYHNQAAGDGPDGMRFESDRRVLVGEANGGDIMAEQQKLRADAIANSGPKVAFIHDVPQREYPEGVLPCIMGRESPMGSVTSLDSLDEVPQGSGYTVDQDNNVLTGIIAKGCKGTKSASKRRVTFSDSIEFDDGVTGQLVTEEKQSTKIYTMLYAKNANNFYNSSSSMFTGPSRKGSRSTDPVSVSTKSTLQNPEGIPKSVTDGSVSSVTHSDHPRAVVAPLKSELPTKNGNASFSSAQWHGTLERGSEENTETNIADQEHVLSDSLEAVQDSLDEENTRSKADMGEKDQREIQSDVSSSPWTPTMKTSTLKDSLELQTTVQRTSHENYVDVPEQVTYHQNFPYPFYTSAGSKHLELNEPVQIQERESSLISVPSQFSASSYKHAGSLAGNLASLAENRQSSSQATNSATTAVSENRFPSDTKDASSRSGNDTNQRKSALNTPQENSPSSVSVRSARSLIPRPPASKKSAKGRVHPFNHRRKQEHARAHKTATPNDQHLLTNRTNRNDKAHQVHHRRAAEQDSHTRNSEYSYERTSHSGSTKAKNRNDVANEGEDFIESIERNMAKINMRTRTAAAEEERQRIVNSLRLQFNDTKTFRQQASEAEVFSTEEDPKLDHPIRKVHQPRVGSAGSRGTKMPGVEHVTRDTRVNSGDILGKNGSHDKATARRNGHSSSGSRGTPLKEFPPNTPVDFREGIREYYDESEHDFPTSTVAFSTRSATASHMRGQPSSHANDSRENSDLKRSISLDRTPTDEEINHLWAHVRSYLHSSSTQSAGSDSCVNRIDVRRSRTPSGSLHPAINQHAIAWQHPHSSAVVNGHLAVANQTAGSTLGGLRRYGSHEVLRRHSSSDSISYKRPPLLQQRATRSRHPQHGHGQTGKPPLPRQHQYNPSPSQGGPSASLSSRVAGPQPLTPAEMQAVMKASENEMLQRQQEDKLNELSPHQQYQALINGRRGPSALSLEEQRLLESLDRLNERLKAQEEITKAIAQKSRMTEVGYQTQDRLSSGSRQTPVNRSPSNRKTLHTR